MKGSVYNEVFKIFTIKNICLFARYIYWYYNCFFFPRFMPSDPVEALIGQMNSRAAFMEPEAVDAMRKTLNESFGLQGSLIEQYFGFFKRVIFTQDFGPSLASYPTPVSELIGRSLPWTLGLMLVTVVMAWAIGNLLGLLAGFRKNKACSKILESIAIIIYPIPYYVLALVLIILFAYIWPIFPLSMTVHGKGFDFIVSLLYNSLLPALSMIIVGTGWWVISMKTISSGIAQEDFVGFARLKGLSESRIMLRYVAPNAALPQVTMLALQIGTIFNGAIITEMLFGYPGMGTLIYKGILQADYNIIMGTITISIIAVATATLIVDLLYPFLDPRIRYR